MKVYSDKQKELWLHNLVIKSSKIISPFHISSIDITKTKANIYHISDLSVIVYELYDAEVYPKISALVKLARELDTYNKQN